MKTRRNNGLRMRWTALCLLMACLGGVPLVLPAGAQELAAAEKPMLLPDSGDVLNLHISRSQALQTSWDIERVAVADPAVADVKVLDGNQILVVANSTGTTDLIVWGAQGESWHATVSVEVDLDKLREDLAHLFPEAELDVTRSQEVYFVKGTLPEADDVAQLHRFFEVSELKYVDMTTLPGLQQVQLKVRVAEANRNAIRRLGVNALHTEADFFGALLTGSEGGGPINPIQMGVPSEINNVLVPAGPNLPFSIMDDIGVSSVVTLLMGFPEEDLEFFIQALAENQYLRILAEPTLVALSGEEASFLAGGEFPIPVAQGTGAGGTSITIEYKEFGVRLHFLPQVLGEGRIRLYVKPEVSELSDVGGVEVQGFNVPSILTRRAETTLELNSGESFAMAGLLSTTSNSRNSRIPLMGDLPVIGSLFRSVRYEKGETELVVLITATTVNALGDPDPGPLPGELHRPPSDWELFLHGRLEGRVVGAAPLSQGKEIAQPGLEKLHGPGPWATPREGKGDILPAWLADN